MDTLAIVILNYNGQPFLAKFLPTVLANADGHPVYVADSASVDSSVSFLRATFPTVRIIELPRNEGYAGGYNLALEHIRTHYGGATYYVLPNSDIDVTPGWLSPSAGAAGGQSDKLLPVSPKSGRMTSLTYLSMPVLPGALSTGWAMYFVGDAYLPRSRKIGVSTTITDGYSGPRERVYL